MSEPNEAVRQWVRDHAYAPDDIVIGSMDIITEEGYASLHKLLDAADPDWREAFGGAS